MHSDVVAVAKTLATVAGSYLQSTIREYNVTCSVCATPCPGFAQCQPCLLHIQSGFPLADRVGSLVYAVEPDSQTYRVLWGYKAELPGPAHRDLMRALLAVGLQGHTPCLTRLAGSARPGWTVVASTRGRRDLDELVTSLSGRPDARVHVRFAGLAGSRDLDPTAWSVTRPEQGLPAHVLVIDDSWVRGGHAQSVAGALKIAGVEQVSIFTVGRVLRHDWKPTADFMRDRLGAAAFDPMRCPWTGAECP